MNLTLTKTPVLKSKLSTKKIMIILSIALVIVWGAAIFTNFYFLNWQMGLKSILIVLISIVSSLVADIIFLLFKKTPIKEYLPFLKGNYSYITALIFALCLPVSAPYYVVIVGSFFATLIVKNLFGGFGYNIFNPAAAGRILVGAMFNNQLKVPLTFDSQVTPSVTGQIDWSTTNLPINYNYQHLSLGFYPAALGEAFSILILVLGIILIILNVINFISTFGYLFAFSLGALFIGLFLKVDNIFYYVLNHLLTGGLIFGAVFMISDPVTSPKNNFGKLIYSLIAGFLTILIRVNSAAYPEGVAFSILIMNTFSPLIDQTTSDKTTMRGIYKFLIALAIIIAFVALNVILSKFVTFA